MHRRGVVALYQHGCRGPGWQENNKNLSASILCLSLHLSWWEFNQFIN